MFQNLRNTNYEVIYSREGFKKIAKNMFENNKYLWELHRRIQGSCNKYTLSVSSRNTSFYVATNITQNLIDPRHPTLELLPLLARHLVSGTRRPLEACYFNRNDVEQELTQRGDNS
jgi:hypothetical protein